ncbi:MAG: AbrB/MazE/SpoVT family DNA-binding domain-containing protein [Bacteroidota bacterium]
MKSELTINERGTLTIPAALRREFGLRGNDRLIAEKTDQGILLRPAVSVPIEMYTDERIAEFDAEADKAAAVLGITPKRP